MRTPCIVALLIALSLLPAGGGAQASCAAPYLTLGDLAVSAGSPLTVEGRAFVEGCDDTGGGDAFGCSTDEGETEVPMEDVLLEVRQAGRTWDVVLAGSLHDGPATLLTSVDGTVLAKQTVEVGVLQFED